VDRFGLEVMRESNGILVIRKPHELVLLDFSVQRRTLRGEFSEFQKRQNYIFHLLPIREKLVEISRLKDVTGKDVRADFRAFVDKTNGDFFSVLLFELLESNSSGKTGRATTNNDDVVFHLVTRWELGSGGERTEEVGGRKKGLLAFKKLVEHLGSF